MKHLHFSSTPLALFVLGLGAAAPTTQAVGQELDTVTVVATRTRNPLDATPASVSLATESRLADLQGQSIMPVMRAMPNVEMTGGPNTDALVPTIRGAQGPSVTLLVDGARQNDTLGGGLRAPVYADPYFLRQVEVLRGASSSLYGSGGNGGVMSLTTLSARDLLEPGHTVGGGVKVGLVGADNAKHLNARVYGTNGTLDALVAVGRHTWDKVKQPNGKYLDPNDGSSNTALVKLGVNPAKATRIELSHQFYESDNLAANNPQASRYKLTTDAPSAAIPFIQPTHVDQRNTVLKATHSVGGDAELEASIYQSGLKHVLSPYATNPAYGNAAITTTTVTETKTDGANVLYTRGLGAHRVAVGADTFRDELGSVSGTTTLTANAVNPQGTRKGVGLFAQDEWQFADAWKLIPTLRYDEFSAQSGTQAKTTHNRLSPKATLAWAANKDLLTYLSYGEGFRAPTVSELFQNSTVGTFRHFLPNPDLRPEIDRTTELGFKGRFNGLWAVGDSLRLRAAVFDSRLKDLITSATLGNITGQTSCFVTGLGCRTQNQNVGNAKRTGAELEASYAGLQWHYAASYGRVRIANADKPENLYSPPDKLTFQVRRVFPEHATVLLWNTTLVAAQDYDSTALRRRAGYSVQDLMLRWQPAGAKYRVDAAITNLLNRAYVVYHSSNVYAATTYQPARSIQVALSADF